ncbi:Rne/Rng family ribonuclease [Bacillus sp. AK128]
MKRTIVMNLLTSEKRIAVLEDHQTVEFYFTHPQQEDVSGNLYAGRITRVLPGMQAVFVDIGFEKNGFLHRDQLLAYHVHPLPIDEKRKKSVSEFAREGELILVQVEKNSVGNKGPKLTNIIELSGQYVVYLPSGRYIAVSKKMESEAIRDLWRDELQSFLTKDEGAIVRTAAEKSGISGVKEELQGLREQYEELQQLFKSKSKPGLLKSVTSQSDKIIQEVGIHTIDEIIVDDFSTYQELSKKYDQPQITYYRNRENIFSHFNIEVEIDRLQKKIVWLSTGAYLIVEHTEALTIIDVNTGKFTGKTNLKETVLKTNEQAAIEIARQIRLRDIGGMILIDFIDMKTEEEKNIVLKVLKAELTRDRTRTIVYGFTRLGILEMTRKRVRENVVDQLTETCHVCGNGQVPAKEALAYKLERELMELRGRDEEGVWVQATRDIIDIFTKKTPPLQEQLEKSLQMELLFTEKSAAQPSYEIRHIGSRDDIHSRVKRID